MQVQKLFHPISHPELHEEPENPGEAVRSAAFAPPLLQSLRRQHASASRAAIDPRALSQRPLFLESLAHNANTLRQISDRKAQRYYETTARAWQARIAAGGL